MRKFVEQLKNANKLYRVSKEVDPRYELGAVLRESKGELPIIFEHVKGYKMPVVGGICGTRKNVALALGVGNEDEIIAKLAQAVVNQGSIELVSNAPVQEQVLTKGFDIRKILPVPICHEKDSGAFLTSAVVVVKDDSGKKYFTSMRRMQVLGARELCILMATPGLKQHFLDCEAAGKALEMALIIGVHPSVVIASQLPTQVFNMDKYAVAAGMLTQPLKLTKCKTIDMMVPAEAEIILEGKVLPNRRESEGPFGELLGYYGRQSMLPVFSVSAVTMRTDPMYWEIFPLSHEHNLPNALMRELVVYNHLKQTVPSVKAVNSTMAGGGRLHLVVSLKKTAEGQGKQAIMSVLGADKDIKHVVVVDEDVDIFSPYEVERAIATCVQADKDVIIVPGGMGTTLDPSHNIDALTCKMGIDATASLAHSSFFEKAKIPGFDSLDLTAYLEKY